jgi:lysophospholipase L1-like esterase
MRLSMPAKEIIRVAGNAARAAAIAALFTMPAGGLCAQESTQTSSSQTSDREPPHKQSYREFRRDVFALSRLDHAAVVMLGDSITEAAPWDELTSCRSIANRGVGGDTTAGVLARLDGVLRLRPRAVFLMIGVNDIALGVARSATLANYRVILDRLNAANLHTFVAYVLPLARSHAKWRNNAAITSLNDEIGGLIAGRPATGAVDLRPLVRNGDGYLREDLSYDGLHPNARGYAIWRDAIAAEVGRFCS